MNNFTHAWHRNHAPITPGQFNAMIPITVSGTDLFAYVKWNGVKGWYDIRVIELINDDEYHKVELYLPVGTYHAFKRFMRRLGVKHMIQIYCDGKPKSTKPSDTKLQELFTPTSIES